MGMSVEGKKKALEAARRGLREAKSNRRSGYESNPSCCHECSTPLPYGKRRNRFCGKSCAATFNNRGVDRHAAQRPSRTGLCKHCSKPLDRAWVKSFCNSDCFHTYNYLEWVRAWIAGEVSGVRNDRNNSPSKRIRRWLCETFGEKCAICGWAEVHPITGRIPVQLDHIDGNSMDSSPENVRLLCPNCHSLTPTFGALNKGQGRPNRYS